MQAVYDRWFCSHSDLEGLDALRARDLIVECFFQAQHEAMMRSLESQGLHADVTMIRKAAEGAVRLAFKRTGGDFKRPCRDSLVRAVESLAGSAKTRGTPADIIEHHKEQIGMVLAGLAR